MFGQLGVYNGKFIVIVVTKFRIRGQLMRN